MNKLTKSFICAAILIAGAGSAIAMLPNSEVGYKSQTAGGYMLTASIDEYEEHGLNKLEPASGN